MDKTIEKEYKPSKKSLLGQVKVKYDKNSIKTTLSKLESAIRTAQSIQMPNRYNLLEIYDEIVTDPHLASVMKIRKERIKGLKFMVYKPNGKPDEKNTVIFKSKWFNQFMGFVLDALFYGNSLIQIIFENETVRCDLMPRYNVIPEFKMIKFNPTSINGDLDYSAPIYSNSLIDVNNEDSSRNLGELLSVIKYVLMKNEVSLNWSQFIELFGQPLKIATTDTEDPAELNKLFDFLDQLGRSGSMVKNSTVDITFAESTAKGSSDLLFNHFVTFVDEQISKKILGGTMVTDSGSSRSQSEVHERTSYLYSKADIVFVERIINDELIPMLVEKGMLTKNVSFSFQEPEIQTVDEKLKIDQFLLSNFNIKDIEYFENRYGTSLEYKKVDSNVQTEDSGL